MKFLMKMLDASVRFIEREGDYALHFFADFIRGNTKYTAHSSSDMSEVPLSYEETRVFEELLQRKKGEKQIDYWKRKKAMLNMKDKKGMVQQEIGRRSELEKLTIKQHLVTDERQKRKLEAQMRNIKAVKYDLTSKPCGRGRIK